MKFPFFGRKPATAPASPPEPAPGSVYHRPYADPALNHLYNLLFCDNTSIWRGTGSAQDAYDMVLRPDTPAAALERIAQDAAVESRVRAVAYNALRARGAAVPRRVLLGTVVETPLARGLDAIAAYVDGRVRYLNQAGKVVVMEAAPAPVQARAATLLAAAQVVVDDIGPWDKARLPPPSRQDVVRMSFLVSDGLYFGEGTFDHLRDDPLGGPVVHAAGLLLQALVGSVEAQDEAGEAR